MKLIKRKGQPALIYLSLIILISSGKFGLRFLTRCKSPVFLYCFVTADVQWNGNFISLRYEKHLTSLLSQ